MKRLISIILTICLALSFVGCGSAPSSTPKIYGQGEEVTILDDSGKGMYTLKINSVQAANDFEYKSDFPKTSQQIIEVDYNYKNIAKGDNKLIIHSADLQVSDITGAVAESSDMFPKQKPQSIPVGSNCTVQGYYGLSNKSDKVKISFSSQSYKKSGTITFEIPVNQKATK